jgi:hypothetical protein
MADAVETPPVVVNQVNNEDLVGNLIAGQLISHTDAKSGFRTTEFWMTVGTIILTVTGAVPVPDHIKGYLLVAAAVAYAISRGIAKAGVAVPVELKAPEA